jgi:hypothetical protein
MTRRYLHRLTGPAVRAARAAHGSLDAYAAADADPGAPDRLGEDEAAFIATRDSLYLASTGHDGWPYIQHRGGPAGFVRVLDPGTLAFADYRGNRQYLTLGNLAADDRVALFLMDYPRRARLKLLGRMRAVPCAEAGALAEAVADPGYKARPERVMVIAVEAFDWNCAAHITPRYTMEDIEPAVATLRARIAALEAENARLKAPLSP